MTFGEATNCAPNLLQKTTDDLGLRLVIYCTNATLGVPTHQSGIGVFVPKIFASIKRRNVFFFFFFFFGFDIKQRHLATSRSRPRCRAVPPGNGCPACHHRGNYDKRPSHQKRPRFQDNKPEIWPKRPTREIPPVCQLKGCAEQSGQVQG